MPKSRFYLTVPFAQKDEVKSLGARWDPARKRWYVPEAVDTAAFQRWFPEDPDSPPQTPKTHSARLQGAPERKLTSPGVVVPSANPDFVPYSGEIPPWE
ncbi:MAG: DUF5710 domain-containing protein [Methylococcus sp.]